MLLYQIKHQALFVLNLQSSCQGHRPEAAIVSATARIASGQICLSSVGNFSEDSAAALAVSVHETGRALQDAGGYSMMRLRSSLVPLVNLSAQLGPYVLLFGILGTMPVMLQVGVLLFAGSVLFHLVTLPVEFNASHRALRQIEHLQLVSEQEMAGARKVLMAAGMAYVAAAATQFAYLLYMMAFSRSRRQR